MKHLITYTVSQSRSKNPLHWSEITLTVIIREDPFDWWARDGWQLDGKWDRCIILNIYSQGDHCEDA